MKLKNKRSGEIKEFVLFDGKNELQGGATLKDLVKEWEDYEEPKEYWYIAELCAGLQKKQDTDNGEDRFNKQIGNYFETKEEAEKAVEKLKAWKRLKDGGFTIRQWRHTPDMNLSTGSFINIKGFIPEVVKNMKDLDLLFGGEE